MCVCCVCVMQSDVDRRQHVVSSVRVCCASQHCPTTTTAAAAAAAAQLIRSCPPHWPVPVQWDEQQWEWAGVSVHRDWPCSFIQTTPRAPIIHAELPHAPQCLAVDSWRWSSAIVGCCLRRSGVPARRRPPGASTPATADTPVWCVWLRRVQQVSSHIACNLVSSGVL